MASLEYGIVNAVDYMGCRIRVRFDDRDGVDSWWIHVPQRNTLGTTRRPLMPEIGEQVAILLDDDGVSGVYLGGIYSDVDPPPVTDQDTEYIRFSDGTSATYDRSSGTLAVDCVGAIDIKCAATLTVESGGPINVKAPSAQLEIPSVSLTGNLNVNGNIQATGTIMDIAGNSNHHTH